MRTPELPSNTRLIRSSEHLLPKERSSISDSDPPGPPPHPVHNRLYPALAAPLPKLAGFRDTDDADFGDLLSPAAAAFGTASTYSAYGGPAADDDDLASNPFADLASASTAAMPYSSPGTAEPPSFSSASEPYPIASAASPSLASPPSPPSLASPSIAAPYSPPPLPSSYQQEQPQSPYRQEEPQSPFFSPADPYMVPASAFEPEPEPEPRTPVSPPAFEQRRSYTREAAPTPETPAYHPTSQPGDPDAFTYNPYASSPPFSSRFHAPSSPREQFGGATGGETAARPTSRTRPDLSALLGDERPPVPSFKRSEQSPRAEGRAGALGSKIAVLPASSVGRKPVAKPLASLLGLEVEDEPAAKSSQQAAAREAQAKPAISSATASAGKPAADPTTTPLPPSRSETPVTESSAPLSQPASPRSKPPLPRTSSDTPSNASQTTAEGAALPYESVVSPLDTGETPRAEDGRSPGWPDNKPLGDLDERMATVQISTSEPESITVTTDVPTAPRDATTSGGTPSTAASENYSQNIFSNATTPASDSLSRRTSLAETASGRGLRAPNGSGDEGGFGGASDADSLRGTYSRSVDVGEAEETAAPQDNTDGRGTPSTDSTAGPEDGSAGTAREVRIAAVLSPQIETHRYRSCRTRPPCRRYRRRSAPCRVPLGALTLAVRSARLSSSPSVILKRSATTPQRSTRYIPFARGYVLESRPAPA